MAASNRPTRIAPRRGCRYHLMSGDRMHPAAELQFERMIGEYSTWRAVPENGTLAGAGVVVGTGDGVARLVRSRSRPNGAPSSDCQTGRPMLPPRTSSSGPSRARRLCPGLTISRARPKSRTPSGPRAASAAVRRQRLSALTRLPAATAARRAAVRREAGRPFALRAAAWRTENPASRRRRGCAGRSPAPRSRRPPQ